MELKERIQKVIKDSGLSLPQFSARIGLARTTLTHYRDGTTPPPIDFLERVCKEFSVNRRWLILGERESASSDESASIYYIDPAVKLVDEAIQETGIKVNDRQKEAIVEIIREEMKSQSKEKVKGILKALDGGSV